MGIISHRQRVLMALNHQEADRIPFDLGSTGNTGIAKVAYDNLKKYLGITTETVLLSKAMQLVDVDEAVLKRFDIDTRGVCPRERTGWEDIISGEGKYTDEWGVTWYKPESSFYYDVISSPFKEELTQKGLDTFNWPDPCNAGRIRGISERVKNYRENTDCAVVLNIMGGFITLSQRLRGLEGWLEDILLEPELIGELLDHTLEFQQKLAEESMKAANYDIDVIHFGDDIGTQNGLMISPKTYREIIKPRQAKLFAAVKRNSNVKILYHSCGSNIDILDDLIEIGVDAYNPVQYNSRGMDCETLKKRFGDRITFWGGIDTSRILPRGTTKEVNEEVRKIIKIFAPGGGYVLNPVHNIQPDVPPENICEMFDSAMIYGKK